jgi:uncharacterized repeat protein (TIGR01451 family)
MKFAVVMMLGLAALTSPAFAEGPLTATLDARRVVVAANGKEALVPADSAVPNDVIEYRTTYRNVGKSTLRGVAATLPVPQGFVFVAGTATRDVLASLDGKTYAPVPLMRVVTLPDGRKRDERVPVAEYRFLRWQLGNMPVNTTNTVVARMRMSDAPAVLSAAR